MRALRITPAYHLIVALLAMAILCAQWVGLQHRIAHADLSHVDLAHVAWSAVTPADDHADHAADPSAEHSCLLLDQATLALGLGTPPHAAQLLPGAPVLALWAAYTSWQAPFTRHFCSRAPPRA